jgi:ketosteroid isomerase-like protein
MTDRLEFEILLRELYDARIRGNIAALCLPFADDATFRIAGPGQGGPVAMCAIGKSEIRPLLALLIKAFKLSEFTVFSILIDGEKAAVHWRAKIHSRIAGTIILTELVDLIELRDNRVASYVEFFASPS